MINKSCVGNLINFTNKSSGSNLYYLWDFGDGAASNETNPKHAYSALGTYTVSLKVSDLVCDDVMVLNNYLTINPNPDGGFKTNVATAECPPLAVVYTDTSSADAISWKWNFGDGFLSTSKNPVHVYTFPGTYTVKLIVSNLSGCTDTVLKSNFIILNGPTGTMTFNPDSACIPNNIIFKANTINTTNYFWDYGDGIVKMLTAVENGDNTTHSYLETGMYTPNVIFKDSKGCSFVVPNTKKIFVDKVVANFNPNDSIFCDLPEVTFDNLSSSFFPPFYEWDFGDGDTSHLKSPAHSYTNKGTYNIILTVTSSINCKSNISKKITIYKAPALNLEPRDTAGCVPFSLLFNVASIDTSASLINSWLWNFGDSVYSTIQNTNHIYSIAGNYNAKINYIYGENVCNYMKNISIKAYDWPIADFIFNPLHPSLSNATINFTDNSSNATSWLWDFGNGSYSTLQNPTYQYLQAGDYKIKLITFNEGICSDTAYKEISIAEKSNIKLPEAFTPNSDGLNDKFCILYTVSVESIDFRVFNRWGELIFETTNLSEGWDGTYKGKPQESGTYSYYIYVKYPLIEKPVLFKGSVTLIR